MSSIDPVRVEHITEIGERFIAFWSPEDDAEIQKQINNLAIGWNERGFFHGRLAMARIEYERRRVMAEVIRVGS